MEGLLAGIPGVVVYIDDILIMGRLTSEHLSALDAVLTRLENAGLCLKRHKSFLMQSCVALSPLYKQLHHSTPWCWTQRTGDLICIKAAPQLCSTYPLQS